MARLQILELPEGSNDDRPPFLLVVDQVPANGDGFEALRRDLMDDYLAARTGARAVLVFEDTIDIPANDTSGYLAAPAKQELVVNLSGDPDAIRDAIAADMQKMRDANEDGLKTRDKDAELRAADERLHGEAREARRALDRVHTLHQPQPDGTGHPDGQQCQTCSKDGGDGYQYLVPWPCPTVRTLDGNRATPDA